MQFSFLGNIYVPNERAVVQSAIPSGNMSFLDSNVLTSSVTLYITEIRLVACQKYLKLQELS